MSTSSGSAILIVWKHFEVHHRILWCEREACVASGAEEPEHKISIVTSNVTVQARALLCTTQQGSIEESLTG